MLITSDIQGAFICPKKYVQLILKGCVFQIFTFAAICPQIGTARFKTSSILNDVRFRVNVFGVNSKDSLLDLVLAKRSEKYQSR